MKVYKFYRKPSEDLMKIPNSEFSIQQKYPLYAITGDKRIAKLFRKTRNMDLFLEKIDDLEKEVVDDLLVSKRSRILEKLELETRINKNTKEESVKYVTVLMTESEFDLISEYGDSGEILNIMTEWVPFEVFSEKMKHVLEKVAYQKSMNFATGYGAYEDNAYGLLELPIRFDLFGIFLYMYSHMLSPEFFLYSQYKDIPDTSDVIHI